MAEEKEIQIKNLLLENQKMKDKLFRITQVVKCAAKYFETNKDTYKSDI